jgi:hypothetical protein
MADGEFRIFLSAVSSEFRSARNALTDDFGARDVLVRVQEQFVRTRCWRRWTSISAAARQ